VKNLLRAVAVLVFCSLAFSLQANTYMQASRAESAPPARADSTAQAKTEQGRPGETLAERSNEAAGKEEKGADEEEKLKHSASVRWIAEKTGMSPNTAYLVFVWFNFLVIAAVMGKYLIKYLPGMFRNRTASIKQSMEDARKASDEANRRLGEIENKLSRLDVDIAAIRAEAEAINKAEETRLQASIEEDRKKIVLSSQQEIEAAATQARRELKVYAADLAVSLAEKKINVDETTDKALVRNFVAHINDAKDGR
jgi:F-type H+-transporting ATPase subunit b